MKRIRYHRDPTLCIVIIFKYLSLTTISPKTNQKLQKQTKPPKKKNRPTMIAEKHKKTAKLIN